LTAPDKRNTGFEIAVSGWLKIDEGKEVLEKSSLILFLMGGISFFTGFAGRFHDDNVVDSHKNRFLIQRDWSWPEKSPLRNQYFLEEVIS
jgi:hypothetical protein